MKSIEKLLCVLSLLYLVSYGCYVAYMLPIFQVTKTEVWRDTLEGHLLNGKVVHVKYSEPYKVFLTYQCSLTYALFGVGTHLGIDRQPSEPYDGEATSWNITFSWAEA